MAFDDLMTDSEREEQIRNWWRDNWAWLVSGIALGILLLIGWRYWGSQQRLSAEQAGGIYLEMMAASDRNDFAQMEALHRRLGDDHDSTPYADQGSLLLARMYVETGEYDKAVPLLRDVTDNAGDTELRRIARLRLARVFLQMERPDDALALLPANASGGFAAFEHEVRGDALHAKGDIEGAREAYAVALTSQSDLGGANRQLIQLKLQDLEAEAAAAGATP